MLKKLTLLPDFRRLVCCFAMALPGMLLQIPAASAQVEGEGVEAVAPDLPETDVIEEVPYDEPVPYDWSNEQRYYDEEVEIRNIDENSWKKAIEGLDYSKEVKRRKKKDASPGNTGDLPNNAFFGNGAFFLWLFRGMLLLVAIVAILLIIKNVVQLKPKPKNLAIQVKNTGEIDLERIEENLNTADLDPLLQHAIAQENYTLAVRLYYLSILKKLSQQKLVFWKKDKTNRDYLRELSATNLYQPFQESTRAFEWVWYGDAVVDKQDFDRLQGQFQNTLSLIPQNDRL